VAPHVNYVLGPCVGIHHVLVLRWLHILTVQVRDDDCVGHECSDVEAQLMR